MNCIAGYTAGNPNPHGKCVPSAKGGWETPSWQRHLSVWGLGSVAVERICCGNNHISENLRPFYLLRPAPLEKIRHLWLNIRNHHFRHSGFKIKSKAHGHTLPAPCRKLYAKQSPTL